MNVTSLLEHCERTYWRDHRSQATLQSNIRQLVRAIGDRDIRQITYADLQSLSQAFQAQGKSPATTKRILDTLSKAMEQALRMTAKDGQPILAAKPAFPSFKIQNVKDRVVSTAEQTLMFETIDHLILTDQARDWNAFRVMIRFIITTACRRSEAMMLTPDHLEKRGERWFVTFERYTTKNSKPRSLPLDAMTAKELLGLIASRQGKLFRFTPKVLWTMLERVKSEMALKGYDMADVGLHTLRHTTLTRAMKRHPIALVSKMAGHSSIQITADRYGHLVADDLVDIVDSLAA